MLISAWTAHTGHERYPVLEPTAVTRAIVPALMTSAFLNFVENLNRAEALLRMFRAGTLKPKPGDKRTRGVPSHEEQQMLRAAVVLTIGTLDAYLSDMVAEVIAAVITSGQAPSEQARKTLRPIAKEFPEVGIELALMPIQADRQERARTLLVEHLTGPRSGTNHGVGGVNSALERISQPTTKVWSRLDPQVPASLGKRDPQTKKTVRPSAKDALEAWTKRRHTYVHRGDNSDVTLPQASGVAKLVAAVAMEVEKEAVTAMP